MPHLPGDTQLRLVSCIDDLFDMKRWLGERRDVMGLDTETSGLDPYAPNARLRTIQIGDHKSGWVIPWEGWGGAAIECLNQWQGPLTLHNISFDAKWLRRHANWEMPWHRAHDTYLMAQIIDPSGQHGLKYLSTKYVDPRADAGEKELKLAMKNNGWGWDTIPLDYGPFWLYSALDPVLAAHLWTQFKDHPYLPKDTYDLEMATRRICTNMEDKGMRVDLEYSQKKFDELTKKVQDAKNWAKENWGIAIGSNPQLAKFFQENLGANFEVFTNGGLPSVNKVQMDLFSKSDNQIVSQVANYILEVRAAEKVSNSYFKNFLSMNNGGLVHPTIKTMGARTGRMSVTDPALQTLPSKDSLVRSAFVPYNDGELILSSDFSQIELRLMAHFSGDPDLQRAFQEADATGGDFFVGMGKEIFRDPEFSKANPKRKLVKSVMYGLIYGAGTQKMADTAKILFEEMDPVVQGVKKTYPGILKFMEDTEIIGRHREETEGVGYITTGTGRRIPSDEGRLYSLVNYKLQGTAAELMKRALIRLDAAGYGPYMQMAIHDEVVMSMPEADVAEARHDIAEVMSYTDGEFAVNLLAEPEGGFRNWGEKYEGKD